MFANLLHIPAPAVLKFLCLPLGLLTLISLALLWRRYRRPLASHHELVMRVKTFWIIVGLLTLSLCLQKTWAILFWGGISYLALKEYFTIIPTRQVDRRIIFWAYVSIPIQYYWIIQDQYGLMAIFIPVYVFLFLPLRMVLLGATQGFLRALGTIHWGVMMMVYCLSCIAGLYVLPSAMNTSGAGIPGLIFYLLFLNQLNDASQFLWGKILGRHKIIPKVSPNKTIEGWVGGMGTTMVFAYLLSPYLTPFSAGESWLLGGVIGAAGFIGDVIISALKRDLGIKDTGNLLPGHGGLLDRIDSLLYTAPLYFHVIRYYYT